MTIKTLDDALGFITQHEAELVTLSPREQEIAQLDNVLRREFQRTQDIEDALNAEYS